MKFKWRKWNRAIHRDLGYVFFAMTVIYALSGIAINHINDWNPNYKMSISDVQYPYSLQKSDVNKASIQKFLEEINEKGSYKKHYFPRADRLKIFVKDGNILINMSNGSGYYEKVTRRPVFHLVNYLHYNPGKWWTLFSDIFAGALILLAVSGLFILRGKNGITRRGAVLTILGIIIPLIYIMLFY